MSQTKFCPHHNKASNKIDFEIMIPLLWQIFQLSYYDPPSLTKFPTLLSFTLCHSKYYIKHILYIWLLYIYDYSNKIEIYNNSSQHAKIFDYLSPIFHWYLQIFKRRTTCHSKGPPGQYFFPNWAIRAGGMVVGKNWTIH